MVLSFAAAAAKSADKPDPSVLAKEVTLEQSESKEAGSTAAAVAPQEADSNQARPSPSSLSDNYRIKHLILDASPLLTQAPIHGLKAQKVYIPPQVVAELKDPKARQHLEWLKLQGMDIEVREGGPEALLQVIAFSKLTGDYAVLSTADLAVLALTYALEVQEHGTWRIRDQVGGKTGQQKHEAEKVKRLREEGKLPVKAADKKSKGKAKEQSVPNSASAGTKASAAEGDAPREQTVAPETTSTEEQAAAPTTEKEDITSDKKDTEPEEAPPTTQDAADEDSDSDAGEWINSDNLQEHKNLALGIVTEESKHDKDVAAQVLSQGADKGKGKERAPKPMSVACITSDYAVQNVMLQMGLALISMSGQKITKVKSWVLRCHACMKICKDQEKKFCPSCGNPTLLRTSVTSSAPGDGKGSSAVSGSAASMGLQVHLKSNFQYKNRGTIYPLPMPKPGSASALKPPSRGGQPKGAVPILREDQLEWQRAVHQEKIAKEKAERQMLKAIEKSGGKKDALSARYDDPDWMPDMLLTANKGRRGAGNGLPAIGAGRKNPNEKRRPRK